MTGYRYENTPVIRFNGYHQQDLDIEHTNLMIKHPEMALLRVKHHLGFDGPGFRIVLECLRLVMKEKRCK
jgi:hypothetical protein